MITYYTFTFLVYLIRASLLVIFVLDGRKNIHIKDLALQDDDTYSRSWPLGGKATAIYPGTDGIVRAVDVLIIGKTYREGHFARQS